MATFSLGHSLANAEEQKGGSTSDTAHHHERPVRTGGPPREVPRHEEAGDIRLQGRRLSQPELPSAKSGADRFNVHALRCRLNHIVDPLRRNQLLRRRRQRGLAVQNLRVVLPSHRPL